MNPRASRSSGIDENRGNRDQLRDGREPVTATRSSDRSSEREFGAKASERTARVGPAMTPGGMGMTAGARNRTPEYVPHKIYYVT